MASINQLTKKWADENNLSCYFSDSIDSTNTWAKSAFETDHIALYLADNQSQGRGRNQNTWTNSSAGETLLSTWCLHSASAPQPVFPLRVGLALYESLAQAWPTLTFALKAPNDIYLGAGKLAGILTEVEQMGHEYKIFIGIGANIFAQPGAVGQTTASLSEATVIHKEDWFKFCFHFVGALRTLQKDAQRLNLTSDEQARLLQALQQHQNNQIAKVQSDGGLILKDGKSVHWKDL